MDKILSQDEVNALLKGIDSGDVATNAAPADDTGARPYDLTSHDRVIRGRMPTLEIINERFARIFQTSMTAALKKIVDVHMASVELMKFGEFMKHMPLPSCINVFKMEPLKGYSLMVIDPRMVYLLIDNFFGGNGQTHVKIEGRDFTSIELRIIKKIVNLCFQDIEKAWKPVHPVTVQLSRTEINPQFASIVTPTEIVMVMAFDIEIDSAPGKIHICIPYPSIEPIKEKLQAGYQSDQYEVDNRWMDRFRKQLPECPVTVTVELAGATVKVRDILNLSAGDVIILDKQVEESIVARIEGVPKFYGRPGVFRGNLALQITSL
ncbi:MAG: flagellar motor switch protein FliM [Nitrospirae bacterium]|nr:flagellar motor switch protein FliM [Nitrospirota bacterium]